jgi:cytochrome c553
MSKIGEVMRSTVLSRVFGILAVAAFASLAPVAQAQDAAAAPVGNADRGATLAYTCLGCHGVANYKNSVPTYNVPRLRGQHADYLVLALQAYQNGERSHATMHANASTLDAQDMADIAAYLGGQALQPSTAPVGTPPAAAQVCVSCHGNDGVGITPQYPTLSGQHESYLIRSLTDYKKGGRKNPIMAGFAGQLTDADILALAEYYAAQRPALGIPQAGRRVATR